MGRIKKIVDDEDDVDLTHIKPRNCEACGQLIPAYRIFCVPDTPHCVKCAEEFGPTRVIDPEEVCAKASPSGQNGFSPRS